jgi:GGDEF domain-containing protein
VHFRISPAVANLRRRETFARRASRDPLTGLFHRRYLAALRTAPNSMPIGVIIPDVDYFQRSNATFDPVAGATLLNRRAQRLRSRTRAGGIAARYDGEQFTLVKPQAPRDSTRVRGTITLSPGGARCPRRGSSAQPLPHAANSALAAANYGGRDRGARAPAL